MNEWDTVSVVSVDLVNQSMSELSEALIERFQFNDGQIEIGGRFVRWQIVPGGSNRLLRLALEIEALQVQGIPGQGSLSIDALQAEIEVGLKLLPDAQDSGKQLLTFDFDGSRQMEGVGPVSPVALHVSHGALSDFVSGLILGALTECLVANADKITYVLAALGTSNPASANWLSPVHSDWTYVETLNRGAYLAVLSVVSDRDTTELSRAIDPAVFEHPGDAFFAISKHLLMRDALMPYVSRAFGAPNGFRYDASHCAIASTKQIKLKPQKSGIWKIQPYIDSIGVALAGPGLHVVVKGHGDLPMGLRVDYRIEPRMPFQFNKKTHVATFARDKNPKVTKRLSLSVPVLDTLVGWFVRFVVSFASSSIERSIQGISRNLEIVNQVPPEVAGWTGLHAFRADDVHLEDCVLIEHQSQELVQSQQKRA